MEDLGGFGAPDPAGERADASLTAVCASNLDWCRRPCAPAKTFLWTLRWVCKGDGGGCNVFAFVRECIVARPGFNTGLSDCRKMVLAFVDQMHRMCLASLWAQNYQFVCDMSWLSLLTSLPIFFNR